uniref:G-protein coupled receptors family 1 profile domain-containing protein n=1 Tax=Maylandia zebra TaxID=106582 RepID=A0A3P9C209_9CICH
RHLWTFSTMNFRVPLFAFTLLYYCMILFFNISLVLLIFLDENLHEPMYIFLSSFCINTIYGTTGFYPKFLSDLLRSSQTISYEGCLLQAFVIYSFVCCDLSILAVMAFDRYLAICRPLHYHSFMTKRRLSQLVCFSWLTPLCIFAINVLLTSRLKLCGINIRRVLCVYHLVWQQHRLQLQIIVYLCHWLFIIWTYIYLIKTCTCVPHLISLMTFLFFLDPVYMIFGSTRLPQSLQNFITIEFLIIPPVMNPLIYGFKLTKIRNRILGLFYFKRTSKLRVSCSPNKNGAK